MASKSKVGTTSSGSLKELGLRTEALRLRTYNLSEAEIAAKIGAPQSWVGKLFCDLPLQTAWNPFNKDLSVSVGPRSKFASWLASWKFGKDRDRLYNNASLSWEWFWSNNITLANAQKQVFTDPRFADILNELAKAYNEAVILNGRPNREYLTWQSWVEEDIARCHAKYAGVSTKVLMAVDSAVRSVVYGRTQNPSLKIAEIRPLVKFGDTSIQEGLSELGLQLVSHGRSSFWLVPSRYFFYPTDAKYRSHETTDNFYLSRFASLPASLVADLSFGFDPSENPSEEEIATSSAKTSTVGKTKKLKATLKGKAKRKKKLTPMLAVLDDDQAHSPAPSSYVLLTEKDVSSRLGKIQEFRYLLKQVSGKRAQYDKYNANKKSPSFDFPLELIKAWMSQEGNVYFKFEHLFNLLFPLYGHQCQAMFDWLIAKGKIIDVSHLTPGEKFNFGWYEYVLGELQFGWRVVEQAFSGGSIELITGEPGSGKTQTLAHELIASRGRCCLVGSATNYSANQLRDRVKGDPEVATCHAAFTIKVGKHQSRVSKMTADVYAGDELGQLSCDAAGVMAQRWEPIFPK